MELWEFETEVAKAKRGVKLLRQLTGVAAVAVDELEMKDIACEDGVKNVLNKLREYFLPHLEVSLPRAFETAVYGPQGHKESFAEYTKRMERAFINLAKEGVDLPDGAKGYIMFRQAALNEAQEQRLLTWAERFGEHACAPKAGQGQRAAMSRKSTIYVLQNASGGHYDLDDDGYQDGLEDEEITSTLRMETLMK